MVREHPPHQVLKPDYIGNLVDAKGRPDKKENERRIAAEFLKRMGCTSYRLHPEDRETPDLLVCFNDCTVGLEVTNYFNDKGRKGSPGQEHFQNWQKVSVEISQELVKCDMIGFRVTCHFLHDSPKRMSGENKKRFVKEAVAFARKHFSDGDINGVTVDHFDDYPTLKSFLEKIYWKADGSQDLWWDADLQSGELPWSHDKLRSIAEDKDRILHKGIPKEVKRGISEIWLLIFARGATVADSAAIDIEKLKVSFDSFHSKALQRIFFWNKPFAEVWELFPTQCLRYKGKQRRP